MSILAQAPKTSGWTRVPMCDVATHLVRVRLVAWFVVIFASGIVASGCGEQPESKAMGNPLQQSGFPESHPRPDYETLTITVGGHPITVEVADTSERRRYGCMFLSELAEDRGMIFVYPSARSMGFWMRNTRIPLDLIYLTDSGSIVNIHRSMKPLSDSPSYPSARPVRFALELPGGWMERHGLWLRAPVVFPPELLALEASEDPLVGENIPSLIGPDAPP